MPYCGRSTQYSHLVILADDKSEKKWPPNVDDSEGAFHFLYIVCLIPVT